MCRSNTIGKTVLTSPARPKRINLSIEIPRLHKIRVYERSYGISEEKFDVSDKRKTRARVIPAQTLGDWRGGTYKTK